VAAVRLVFSKTWFLSTGSHRAVDYPSRYQIWCKNVDRRRNYGPKSKSKMAAVCHFGFSKTWFLSNDNDERKRTERSGVNNERCHEARVSCEPLSAVERLQELQLVVYSTTTTLVWRSAPRQRLLLKSTAISQCQAVPPDCHRHITTTTQLTNSPANILSTVLRSRLAGVVNSRLCR